MKIGLSVSCGGLRGVVSIVFLSEVLSRAGLPASKVFSIISGTSTGAIIAGLISKGYTPDQIMSYYYQLGPEAFPSDITGALRQLVTVRYDINKLVILLDSLFKGTVMADAAIPLMIPCVDAEKVCSEHIKSYNPWWSSLSMAKACASSAAAQTYFKALPFTQNGQYYRMIDGGNFAGNPSDDLMSEMRVLYPDEDIFILNLGVGRLSNNAKQPLKDAGALGWAAQLFRASSEPQDDNATKKCQRSLGDNFQYLDVDLPYIPAMNDARQSTLDFLVNQAKNEAFRSRDKITMIANILKENANV